MSDPIIIAIVLGIIEGITEFLPISSTGHLLIAEHFNAAWKQTDLFNVVIQCGAVIAVLPLFPDRLKQFLNAGRDPKARDYLAKVLLAFFITGVGGFIMEKKHFKLEEHIQPVAWALLIGGVAFLLAEALVKKKHLAKEITWAIAIAVGFGQLIAAGFPGASRSGTTIILCLLLGLARPEATEYCFLVGIPTMLAAGGYKIFKALHHPELDAPKEHWGLVLLTTAIAAVVSFIAVKWLLRYVRSHTFNAFGWYRVAFGALLLILAAKGIVS